MLGELADDVLLGGNDFALSRKSSIVHGKGPDGVFRAAYTCKASGSFEAVAGPRGFMSQRWRLGEREVLRHLPPKLL